MTLDNMNMTLDYVNNDLIFNTLAHPTPDTFQTSKVPMKHHPDAYHHCGAALAAHALPAHLQILGRGG